MSKQAVLCELFDVVAGVYAYMEGGALEWRQAMLVAGPVRRDGCKC